MCWARIILLKSVKLTGTFLSSTCCGSVHTRKANNPVITTKTEQLITVTTEGPLLRLSRNRTDFRLGISSSADITGWSGLHGSRQGCLKGLVSQLGNGVDA